MNMFAKKKKSWAISVVGIMVVLTMLFGGYLSVPPVTAITDITFYINPVLAEGELKGATVDSQCIIYSYIDPEDYTTFYQEDSGDYIGQFIIDTGDMMWFTLKEEVIIEIYPTSGSLQTASIFFPVTEHSSGKTIDVCIWLADSTVGNRYTLARPQVTTYVQDSSKAVSWGWSDDYWPTPNTVPTFNFGDYESIFMAFILTAHLDITKNNQLGKPFYNGEANDLYNYFEIKIRMNVKFKDYITGQYFEDWIICYTEATYSDDGNPVKIYTNSNVGHMDPLLDGLGAKLKGTNIEYN
ncbi:MAG: hypothetical protein QCI82_07285 [Candidatus Thermoplasmatota archaeon]|nr:hypothetical protein [Candidatus Thermoplasmatota archaeon]